jgi:hypothetical protein
LIEEEILMRKRLLTLPVALVLLATSASAEIHSQHHTLYDLAEHSWAVGVVMLGHPLTFREGKVLAFPSQIDDLVWAPKGTKPRNLMFVYEVGTDEKDHPYFNEHDVFLAPIRLLPEHSYWKDNLPNTPRHDLAGGRRYAFRGNDIPEVKKVLAEFLTASDKHGLEGQKAELRAVVGGLGSPVAVVREDSVRFLADFPTLQRDFEDAEVPAVSNYLASRAPTEGKQTLVDALTKAKVMSMKPALTELAKRNDAIGALALRGLTNLGETPDRR